jgi:hypothetical protein
MGDDGYEFLFVTNLGLWLEVDLQEVNLAHLTAGGRHSTVRPCRLRCPGCGEVLELPEGLSISCNGHLLASEIPEVHSFERQFIHEPQCNHNLERATQEAQVT